ncbi:hypothetical protein GCM10010495_76530 [Kitasatospora herbaricolor]|uniref:hypothetical protein n=1 Tax=Kitasatospora herbaricolor TaxID=68217 RepID=UPI00174ECBFF|nr:hypothetical protein [Kitasatospora herbaricolor]MDQ0305529.1 hypothetical protein [Kitasatospora herbaricolor]GGV47570.1 hypothetical protein GCM10010495_76530 [Kitasatospora herbaricolor]
MSSRPRPIPPLPGYAPHLAARLLPDVAVAGVPDYGPPLWRVVEVRVNGYWRPGILSAWRRLPLGWAGRVRWSPGAYGVAWVLHTPWSLRPAVLLHPAPTPTATPGDHHPGRPPPRAPGRASAAPPG